MAKSDKKSEKKSASVPKVKEDKKVAASSKEILAKAAKAKETVCPKYVVFSRVSFLNLLF